MTAMAKEKCEVVLRTQRLVLAPLRPKYAAPLFELLNDWDVVKMLAEVPWPLRLEDTVQFIAKLPSPWTDDFAILAPSDPVVGQSHTSPLIMRRFSDAVGNASKEDREGAACFEAPLRGAPQHEEGWVRLIPIGVATVKKPGSGNPPRKMPRLGYWIGRKYWGQGYGTEAIGALVDFAFRNYPAERVGAGVFHDNAASRALLEKLGFTAMGPGSCMSRSRGNTVVTVDMQLTRNEWAEALARQQ